MKRILLSLLILVVSTLSVGSGFAQDFRHVYVPIDDLDVLFKKEPGVILDRNEFLELWNKAYPEGWPREKQEQQTLLHSVAFQGTVEEHRISLQGTLEIRKESEKPEFIKLPFQGVGLQQASLGDQPAQLGLDEEGNLRLYLEQAGTFELKLQLSAPLSLGEEASAAAFRLPPVPGELVLAAPENREILSSGVRMPQIGKPEENKYRIALGAKGDLQLAIVRQEISGERKPLVLATTSSVIQVEPAELTWNLQATVEAYAQPIEQLTIRLPVGYQVVDVQSEDLSRWDTQEQEQFTLLTLQYQNAWTDTRTISVKSLGSPELEQSWKVPHAMVISAAAQQGQIEIRPNNTLALVIEELTNLQRLPDPTEHPGAVRFRYWQPEFTAQLHIKPKQQKLSGSVATFISIDRTRLQLRTDIRLQSQNASLFSVPLTLDAAWFVSSIKVAGQQVPFRSQKNGEQQRLEITLPKPIPPEQFVQILVEADLTPDGWLKEPGVPSEAPLSTITVVGLEEVEGLLVLRAPEEIQLTLEEVENLEPVSTSSLPAPRDLVRYALRYRTPKVQGKILATRTPVQWSVETHAAVHRTETFLSVLYALKYQPAGGVADELNFSLPNVEANQVRVTVEDDWATIVGQSVDTLPEGRKRWNIKLHCDIRQPITLHAYVEIPSSEEDERVELPLLRVQDAVRQTGTIAVYGSSDQEVQVSTEELRSLDPSELPTISGFAPPGRLVGAYQFRQPNYYLTLETIEHPEVPVLIALCKQATIYSVLDTSGVLRHKAEYQVENVGLRQLAVTLPEGATLLAATSNDEPITIRRSGSEYLLELSQSRQEVTKAKIDIDYQTEVSNLQLHTSVTQKPPQLNIPVLKLDWKLYVPQNQYVVKSSGTVRPVQPLTRDSFIGQVRHAIADREGREIFNPLYLVPIFWGGCGAEVSQTFNSVAGTMEAPKPDMAASKSAPQAESERSLQERSLDMQRVEELQEELYDEKMMKESDELRQQAPGLAPPQESRSRRQPQDSLKEPNLSPPPKPAEAGQGQAQSEERLQIHSVLPSGKRRVSIPVRDESSAIGGWVQPGNRVDVQWIYGHKRDPNEETYARTGGAQVNTLLRNAKVLARDGGQVTLEVSAEAAKKLQIAAENGELALTLRGLDGEKGDEGKEAGDRGPGGLNGGGARYTRPQALLSLKIDLQRVGREYEFVSLGTDGALTIQLQDDGYTRSVMMTLALGLIFLGWLLRWSYRSVRVFYVLMLLALAIGLSGLTPLRWLFVLDGLFFGAVGTLVLYAAAGVIQWLASWGKPKPGLATATLLLICLFGVSEVVLAQEQQNKTESKLPLPTIYIPYDVQEDPMKSKQVFLPRQKYEELQRLANPSQDPEPTKELAGSITSAEFQGKVVGNKAEFALNMTMQNYREGWTAFAVPVTGVLFSEVKLDGKNAVLSAAGEPSPDGKAKPRVKAQLPRPEKPPFAVVFVQGKGEHKLEVRSEAAVQRSGGQGELTLYLGQVASGTLELTLPKENLEASASGFSGGWQQQGKTLTATLGKAGKVTMLWKVPSPRQAADLLASVDQRTRLFVQADGIRRLSQFDYHVRQGTVETLEFQLPEPILVRKVQGAATPEWTLQGEGDQRRLVVRPTWKLSKQFRLELDLFLPLKSDVQEAEFPAVQPLGISRETGQIAVSTDPALDVSLLQISDLQRIDRSRFVGPQVPQAYQQWKTLVAYRYASRPFRLQLGIEQQESKLTARVFTATTISTQRLDLSTRIQLEQSQPLISARIRLPEGFELNTVFVQGMQNWSLGETDDPRVIEIARVSGWKSDAPHGGIAWQPEVTVEINGWIDRAADESLVTIPAFEVLETTQTSGQWALYLRPGLDAVTEEIEGLTPISPNQLNAYLRSAAASPLAKLGAPRMAFRLSGETQKLSVRLKELEPQLQAEVVTVVSVREVETAYLSQIAYQIQQAGVRQVRFTAPRWFGIDPSISTTGGVAIRQIQTEEREDGTHEFTVRFDQEVFQELQLLIVQKQSFPENLEIVAPRLQPLDTETVTSYVILENRSPDELTRISAEDLEVEPVEARREELPLTQTLRNNAVEILRWTEGTLAWKLRVSKAIEARKANVNLADLTMVIDRDGNYRAQMNYRVYNRQEQFLAVQFPEGCEVWSVFVAGEPAQPATGKRNNTEVILIPLPKTAAGEFASEVELVYVGEVPRIDGPLGSFRWDILAPQVLDLPVAETQLTLYLPKNLDYGVYGGNMQEADASYLELSRQVAQYREAFQLFSVISSGKGKAKEQALDNLLQMEVPEQESLYRNGAEQPSEKTQQLQQKAESTANELRQKIQNLRENQQQIRQREEVQTEAYFQMKSRKKFVVLGELLDDQRNAPKSGYRSAQKDQASRQKLQSNLFDQTRELQQQAKQFDEAEAPNQQAAPIEIAEEPTVVTSEAMQTSRGTLRIELPETGNRLHFVKPRGQAKISIAFTPAEQGNTVLSLVWLVVSLLIALFVTWVFSHSGILRTMAANWAILLLGAGLVWWLLLPLSFFGFLAAVVAGISLIWQRNMRDLPDYASST